MNHAAMLATGAHGCDASCPLPGEEGLMDTEHPTIKAAIDAVEARADARATITLPVMQQFHKWTGDAEITLTAPSDPNHPCLMVWEPSKQAWRVILLPPDSEWTVRRTSGLWTPQGRA